MNIALLSATLAAVLWAQPGQALAASSSKGDCLSCHSALKKRRFAHGPVGVGMCSACHGAEKPVKEPAKHHTFTPTKEQPELCLSCHDGMRPQLAGFKVPHPAIESGCTSCHDPHGSEQRFFLKGKTMDQTCSACHEAKTKAAVIHKPVGTSCGLCHDPHGSANAKLLKAASPELCFGCHAKVRQELGGSKVHAPVKAGCVSCHDPHSAPKEGLLKADGRKGLCIGCHKKVGERVQSAKRPHEAVEKSGCVGCHSPHASNHDHLVKEAMPKLCVGCHAGMKAEVSSPFLHGPTKLGECTGCHDAHGADNPKILRQYFPEGFYNPYKDGLYSLCFNCHEKDIAKDERTKTLTDFRNGDQNLHYLHVHAQKGRSCKACHQVHGGRQEKHVRENVPFGTWMLPINFKRTARGGTCNVGCHNPKAYDRSKAVDNP
ncbi:MAG: cytochrome C [Elusimicrobia bacterium]|nr:cytochrome C [Elusimicrobiota bacterium]